MTKEKPRVIKAIMTALLALIIFVVVYFLSYLIVGGIIYLLLQIPIIDRLLGWLFHMRGDSPDMMLSILAPGIAYLVTMAAQEAINKDAPTRGLSCAILGIIIAIMHILFLVINLIYGAGILKNIVQAIIGFVIFSSGMGDLKESKENHHE